MAFDQAYVPLDAKSTLTHIWNVTKSVGKGGQNHSEDVKLVQYMLKKVYDQPDLVNPKGEMKIDGVCGPITKNWILKFQIDLNGDFAGLVSMDGLIDRAHGARTSLPGITIAHMFYTIVPLNMAFQDDYPDIHANPLLAADMPQELKMALSARQLPVAA